MIDPGPEFYSPARRERRQKLLKLAEASFPDGVPSPYAVLPSRSRENLPFVCATISLTNDCMIGRSNFGMFGVCGTQEQRSPIFLLVY
jgi:hypothetical protein